MKAGTIASVALTALMRNKMRSLLTTLGVVIGVAAVIIMQGMGQGATAYVGNTISGLGTNIVMVIPGASRGMGGSALGVPLFTVQDVDAIRRGAPAVARISGAGQRILRVVAGGNNWTTVVNGISPDYFEIRSWGVSRGRNLSADDDRSGAPVCVIGRTVAEKLFPGHDPVGSDMRIHDVDCRIIGELESKGSAIGMDQDDIVFMPLSTFTRRILGTERIAVMITSAASVDRIDEAKDQITSIMRHRRHILPGDDDDFSVRDPREMQAVLQTVTGTLTTVLAGVAAISLLVGGIGIMNIMLVSVTERTREIGIRLAVGARSADILRQFLVESTVLSAAGGLVGIALGVLGIWGVSHALSLPFVVPVAAPPIAFAVSLLVGVVFGVFPARKASHLNPLDALRYE